MQLSSINIRPALSLACAGLLGSASSAYADDPWHIEMGVMNYNEQDRNTGLEFVTHARKDLDDKEYLQLNAELDVITGATPNGATSSNTAQTITMASGLGSYTVPANQLPVDDTHMDTRMSLASTYSTPVGDHLQSSYNAHLSMEFDFFSLGAGTDWSYTFNQNNTQLHLGANLEYDRVHPVGAVPIPLAQMQVANTLQPREATSVTKHVYGISTGITQNLTPRSLIQLLVSRARYKGYLNDPYRLLSVINDINQSGDTLGYRYENRPGLRKANIAYVRFKQSLTKDVMDLSYHYYHDDWHITSSTLELNYHLFTEETRSIIPSIRYYHQSQADFYRHSLPVSTALPRFASSDYRLAEYTAITLGLEYKWLNTGENSSRIGVHYYQQDGTHHPDDAIGLQQQQDLYPNLKAWILTYTTQFDL